MCLNFHGIDITGELRFVNIEKIQKINPVTATFLQRCVNHSTEYLDPVHMQTQTASVYGISVNGARLDYNDVIMDTMAS